MIPTLPVIIRLDGNNFHNWTKGLNRPFDDGFINLMIDTTKFLTKETNAIISYTQSDEITLILYSDNRKSAIYHEGKKQKILSKLTGSCVNYFNDNRKKYLPNHNKLANFDCRVYQTPTLNDAALQLLWRENDATRNSILSLAQSLFPHNDVMNLNTSELQDKMMLEKEVNWDKLSTTLKRGTYIKRFVETKKLSVDELESLPEKHNARKNPDLLIKRNIIQTVDFPILSKIKNRSDVIFDGDEPVMFDVI